MGDHIYLSLWLRSFEEQSMLAYWRTALQVFPESSLLPGIRTLLVQPFEWSEVPALEESFAEGATVDQVFALASEFLHDDFAYEAGIHWDVWNASDGGSLTQWEKVPQLVRLACFGPNFDSDVAVNGHLQIDFGLDFLLLPPEDANGAQRASEGVAGSSYRDNIQQLLSYLRHLDGVLPVEKKLLWSASGENLGEQIRAAWGV